MRLFAPNSKNGKLTSLQRQHDEKKLDGHDASQQSKLCDAEKSIRSNSTNRSAEIVAAMKKLDAKLVAYLAGEDLRADEKKYNMQRSRNTSPMDRANNKVVEEHFLQQQLQVFKRVTAIRLQMEALTLQPEGTKRMELLQTEIRPIFTVECQLSNELIQHVPRYELFNIMQFESEKFHSLTQCTRFGQEAKRDVRLIFDENVMSGGIDKHPNFGRIQFIVWWREPGTCLNETLGIGVLELAELYNASLLEQCKCITINRRGIHLASLYFKISLQLQRSTAGKCDLQLLQKLLGQTSIKQCAGGGVDEKQGKQQHEQEGHQQKEEGKTSQENVGNEDAASQNKNNNFQLGSSNFTAETTKVRCLKGFIYVNEMRNLTSTKNCDYFLVYRRFWQNETKATLASREGNRFNYQEQFAVLNDEKFLKRVEKQHMELELWQRHADDCNANSDVDVQPSFTGTVRLPLHQFFIAFRDSAMTNHICKGKLPVISIDAWVPIASGAGGTFAGELKCLLAVGCEEQIENLKKTRGFERRINAITAESSLFSNSHCTKPAKLSRTGDLLDMLQQTLMIQSPTEGKSDTAAAFTVPPLPKLNSSTNSSFFKLSIEILRATGLPFNPPTMGKRGSKRQVATAAASDRFPSNKAPSSYVTFQAQEESLTQMYKSHEGMVYATIIIDESTEPQWHQCFRVCASVEYLINPQKRFILKIWKKSATVMAKKQMQPTPMDDAIIGFAALDFTAFQRGLQIGGWFNIVDFNGRINGKLEIRCHPLENIARFLRLPQHPNTDEPSTKALDTTSTSVDVAIEQFADALELTHLNLGQAIKRKFTELEQVSQNLRTRLFDVTGEQFAQQFDPSILDSWQPLGNDMDADLDEFERDLNMVYINTSRPTSPTQDINSTKMISEAPSGDPKE